MDLTRSLILIAIRFYQRVLSPLKGFRCAYRAHTGHASCSELGYRAIRRFGVGRGFLLLRERTRLCGLVHRRFHPPLPRPRNAQRGDCDLPCDLPGHGCDLPSGRLSACGDALSCLDCGSCDWPHRDKARRPRRSRERQIPPARRRPD